MRNPSSISNFDVRRRLHYARWSRSGLLWTALAVACIEFVLSRMLPGYYFRHEVDELLHDVRTKTFSAPNVSLGNSVGRQLDRGINRLEPGFLTPLASNGALETTGQYLLFRRYLDRNPMPENLILWLDNPFAGNLHLIYTENYIQRCFLEWREIALICWWKGSPTFAANMLAYKLLPSYRYRMEIQAELDFLDAKRVHLDIQNTAFMTTGLFKPESAFVKWWQRRLHGDRSLSYVAFERLLKLCQANGVRVYYIPTPLREEEAQGRGPRQGRERQIEMLEELRARYSALRYLPEAREYPDDWFPDKAHFAPRLVPRVSREYLNLLKEWMAADDAG
jgi:hypothetical protein